jgi:hypothetical protein
VFENQQRKPDGGIARVFGAAEIAAAGGDPEAFLAVEAAVGTYFAAGYTEYELPATYKATHGYDPERADMKASLLLFGPSVPEGTLRGARLIDIAPTVAGWLGLELPGVDGKPLEISPRLPVRPVALSRR